MNKLEVIQRIINHINAKKYLEIGVHTGMTISKIKIESKIGVDPNFRLTRQIRLKKFFGLTKFDSFEETSDDFFNNHAKDILTNGIDIAFIDGLHTYEQGLKDIENCLEYLNDNGFIICHDCNPINFVQGYPVKNSIQEVLDLAKKGLLGWTEDWVGDIWKAIVHIRLTHPDLNVFTLDTDYGLGIITKGNGINLKNVMIEELKKADYYFFKKRRHELINLKTPEYLENFLNKY